MSTDSYSLIVGLGKTGLSCARYFAARGFDFRITDSRPEPPCLAEYLREFPGRPPELGGFRAASFLAAGQLVVSPGIALKTAEIQNALAAGIPVTGDIDLFSREVKAPVIAVTGSNGKSTVVSLVAEILAAANLDFGLGGNLDGSRCRPALELLLEPSRQLYVLELSSFQLETTAELGAAVCTVLNVTEDHMDRYDTPADYLRAKQRIFRGAAQVVFHRDDPLTWPPQDMEAGRLVYGSGRSGKVDVWCENRNAKEVFVVRGETLMPTGELKLAGQHNLSNAMAAIALTLAAGIDPEAIAAGLRSFIGLPDRCQWVATVEGVDYFNDSKGTNVGATLAAVEGLGRRIDGKLVLIAGGLGKGADFSPLSPACAAYVRHVILIGIDGQRIDKALTAAVPRSFATDLQQAVLMAADLARSGDSVLLSPACASFDMFRDFHHRGQVFAAAVRELA